MIDNLQSYAAYATNALLVSQMNFKPGEKQAYICDDWFISNGEKITQFMNFPANHPEYSGIPKDMKEVLIEHGF